MSGVDALPAVPMIAPKEAYDAGRTAKRSKCSLDPDQLPPEASKLYRMLQPMSRFVMIHNKPPSPALVTFVFDESRIAEVQSVLEQTYPGSKSVYGTEKYTSKQAVHECGEVPRAHRFEGCKYGLPPTSQRRQMVCKSRDIDRHNKKKSTVTESAPSQSKNEVDPSVDCEKESGVSRKRQFNGRITWIAKSGPACRFEYQERKHSHSSGDVYSLSFELDSVCHTCSSDSLPKYPLLQSDYRIILQHLTQLSPEEVFKQVVLPASEKVGDGSSHYGISKLTIPELNKIAKKHNILNQPKAGDEDFSATEVLLSDLQSRGATVACKRPGMDPKDCPMLAERAKQHLSKDDCFIFITTSFQAKLLHRYGKIISSDGTHCVLVFNKVKLIAVMVGSYGEAGIEDKGELQFLQLSDRWY